jgi:general secretion pathway protein C
MLTHLNSPWWPRLAALAFWGAAAASATFWGLRMTAAQAGAGASTVAMASAAQADPGAVARFLGAVSAAPGMAAIAPAQASRFVLTGVVASASRRGAALIAVDGKPPKPYRVGARIEEGLVLQGVAPRKALLGPAVDGPASFTLELPVPKS